MKRFAFSTCILATLLLSGCASGPQFAGLEEPNPDESIIYYLRAKRVAGSGVFYTIHENGKPITKLYNGGYYPHHTEPGDKHIEATTESTSELYLTAEKGKRHYVYGDISMGFFVGRPKLQEIDEETALTYLKDCKLLEKAE